jgi:hypothetical protein
MKDEWLRRAAFPARLTIKPCSNLIEKDQDKQMSTTGFHRLEEGATGYYRIQVKGNLHENWSEWFGGLSIELEDLQDGSKATILQGSIKDQAALRGILVNLLDLNLVLVSIQQIQAPLEAKDVPNE